MKDNTKEWAKPEIDELDVLATESASEGAYNEGDIRKTMLGNSGWPVLMEIYNISCQPTVPLTNQNRELSKDEYWELILTSSRSN